MAPREDNLGRRVPRPALIALAVYHVALGLLMALAPGTFFEQIGPFGDRNDHYIRDVSTFYLAFGVAFGLAVSRRSWRVPLLALIAIQYAFHAVNHRVDIGDTEPARLGPIDFATVTILGALLFWLARVANRDRVGEAA